MARLQLISAAVTSAPFSVLYPLGSPPPPVVIGQVPEILLLLVQDLEQQALRLRHFLQVVDLAREHLSLLRVWHREDPGGRLVPPEARVFFRGSARNLRKYRNRLLRALRTATEAKAVAQSALADLRDFA